MRIAVLGNAGSGKSTLAAKLAAAHDLPLHEMDKLMWQPGWAPVPEADFAAAHDAILTKPRWIIDGMGRKAALKARLQRATHVILCDFPLWQNYWLLAQRQVDWTAGRLDDPPGGQSKPPSTRDLFAFVWNIDQDFMPDLRQMVDAADDGTRRVIRFSDFAELESFDGLTSE